MHDGEVLSDDMLVACKIYEITILLKRNVGLKTLVRELSKKMDSGRVERALKSLENWEIIRKQLGFIDGGIEYNYVLSPICVSIIGTVYDEVIHNIRLVKLDAKQSEALLAYLRDNKSNIMRDFEGFGRLKSLLALLD